MKATMDELGVITVKAETPLESWALTKWLDTGYDSVNNVFNADRLIVDVLATSVGS